MYDKVLEEMKQIHEAKNHDYGDSAHRTFEMFGLNSYLVRMFDKLNRAAQIDQLRNGERQKVKDEKIYDTLIDLANYAAMAAAELKANENPEV